MVSLLVEYRRELDRRICDDGCRSIPSVRESGLDNPVSHAIVAVSLRRFAAMK